MTTPDERLRQAAETYRAKNDDYGDSWRKVGALIWELADEQPIVLESPEDVIRFGLYTRRLDKISGAFQGDFVADEELNFEDAANRHEDEGTYAFMHSSTYGDAAPDEPVDDSSHPMAGFHNFLHEILRDRPEDTNTGHFEPAGYEPDDDDDSGREVYGA